MQHDLFNVKQELMMCTAPEVGHENCRTCVSAC